MTVQAAQPMRVLMVDHAAGVAPFRRKYEALARFPDVELTVFAPSRWVENYRPVRATASGAGGYELVVGRVVWPGYENRAFFLSGLGSIIRRSRPDILHLWEEPFSFIALQALWHTAIWAPRAKVLFHSADNLSRDFRYPYRPSWLYARVERLVHRRCAGGTFVSEEVARVLRAKGFEKPLEIAALGLDLADYSNSRSHGESGAGAGASSKDDRGPFDLRPPVVGFAGRLQRQKGVDLLLRAAAAIPEPPPSIAIVGDGPEREALVRLSRDLGISGRTRFVPMVEHREVPALLRHLEVLVLPSRTTPRSKEQFGRVLVEGMAAGCVVVGSTSGAIPEVIGDAGLVFREEDVGGLAAALERVLKDPGLAQTLRRRGRQRVEERFTWDAVAARIVPFYRRLLEPVPSGRELPALEE